MTSNQYRLPAEWEPVECVLMSWPHAGTDWAYMLRHVHICFCEIVRAIAPYARVLVVAPDIDEPKAMMPDLVDSGRLLLFAAPTNDTWARDFGPICSISKNGIKINDFKFNGWGLKFAACHDNIVTSKLTKAGILSGRAEYVNHLGFVLEGGSIDSDGAGTVLTTSNCLLSANRNGDLTKDEIEDYLVSALPCERVLWVDYGDLEGDDTDSHIDTLARFLPGNIIAATSCDRIDDTHFGQLSQMLIQLAGFNDAQGRPYNIITLPIPDPIYDAEGNRLPATYANFLIVNKAVIMPVYGDPIYDPIAIKTIKAAMPLYKVVTVDCRALIQQHGSLHCMTMQLPAGALI